MVNRNLGYCQGGELRKQFALVKIIENSKKANELLIRSKGDTFVFHTSKEELSLTIVQNPVYRV